ncbi:MAG: hypothetical protein QXL94_00770 [Candidatus Parvarchaeum sp.]
MTNYYTIQTSSTALAEDAFGFQVSIEVYSLIANTGNKIMFSSTVVNQNTAGNTIVDSYNALTNFSIPITVAVIGTSHSTSSTATFNWLAGTTNVYFEFAENEETAYPYAKVLFPTGTPLSVSLTGNTTSPLLGSTTTLTGSFSGGISPYSYSWSGAVSGSGSTTTASSYGKTYYNIHSNTAESATFGVTYNGYTRNASYSWTSQTFKVNYTGNSVVSVPWKGDGVATWKSTSSGSVSAPTYKLLYTAVGGTAGDYTYSTTLLGTNFTLSSNSTPNDETLGTFYMAFEGYVTYGGVTTYSTTDAIKVTVNQDFNTNIAVSGIRNFMSTPTQNPILYAYTIITTTSVSDITASYNWYSTSGLTTTNAAKSTTLLINGGNVYQLAGNKYATLVAESSSGIYSRSYFVESVFRNGTDSTTYSTSSLLTIKWLTPLSVNISPQSTEVTEGVKSTVSFAVDASGAESGGYGYTCEIYNNGILAASSTNYSITTTFQASTTYSIYGNVTSNATGASLTTPLATLKVNGPITLNVYPNSLTGVVGHTYTFTAAATGGTPPYTYTWSFPSTTYVIGGLYSPTLEFSSNISTTGSLGIKVSDHKGSSAVKGMGISIFNSAPVSLTANKGSALVSSTVELIAGFTGSGYYNAYLYVNGVLNKTNTMSGIQSTTFTYSTTSAGAYSFYVKALDTKTNVITSSNSLTVNYFEYLSITLRHQYSTTVMGNALNFTAIANDGIPPYTYAWYVNDVYSTSTTNIVGSTQNITIGENVAGTYYVFCHITSNNGNTSQNSAISTTYFVSRPSVSITGSASLNKGVRGTWTPTIVGGSGSYQYTWYVNGNTDTANGNFSDATFSSTFSSTGLYNIELDVYDVGYRYRLPMSNTVEVAVGSINVSLESRLTLLSNVTETTKVLPHTSTYSTTSNYLFTVIVGGRNVYATNIESERCLDLAGELQFTVLKNFMYSTTNGVVSFIQQGSPVQFYLMGKLVFNGTVETVNMKSNMQYDIIAYDGLYYLAGVRANTSAGGVSDSVDLGSLVGLVAEYGTVNYNAINTGYGGFSAVFGTNDQMYYDVATLATILGYEIYLDNVNTLHLQPFLGSSTFTITENNNNMFSSTFNDTNYYYNSVQLEANTISNGSFVLTTTTAISNIGANATTPKRISMDWLGLSGSTTWANGVQATINELAVQALKMFPDGYREVDIWYSLNSAEATTFFNIGNNYNITLNFADGRSWTNMFIEEVYIDATGLYLTCVNFPKSIWSQMQTVTGYSP